MIAAVSNRVRPFVALLVGAALGLGCSSMPDPKSRDGELDRGVASEWQGNLQEHNADREKAIVAYREHLARYPDSPEYDAVKRRLADLLLSRASDLQSGGDSTGLEQDVSGSQIQASYREAIVAYEYLLARSPGDIELLYQLSRAYEESGQPRRALATVEQLLAQSSGQDPRLRSDTLFRQGELRFDADDFVGAEAAYSAVISTGKNAPAFEQSLYKLGWSLYKQGKYLEALDPFYAYLETLPGLPAVESSPNSQLSPVEQEQLSELLDVMSSCFVHLGGLKAAQDFFASGKQRAYERELYLALADWYEEQLQVSQAAETWLFIAQRAPLSEDAPTLTARAVRVYREAGFERLAFETSRQLVDAYGPRSEFWLHHEKRGYPEELRLIDDCLIKLGSYYHQQSIDAPGLEYDQMAERYYRDYLVWFGGTSSANIIQFQLAELLAEQGRYSEAYRYYEDLAWGGGEETLAAAAALEALQINAGVVAEADPDRGLSRAMHGRDDAVRFVVTFPDHEAAPRVLARVGGEMLDQNESDALVDLLGSIIQRDAVQDELMLVAWTLAARAAHSDGDFSDAVEAYRSALEYAPQTDERRVALTTGLATALLDAGKQSARQKQWDVAASRFEEAGRYATADDLRQSAHYAEATVYLAQNQWEQAIELLQTYRRRYPDSPNRQEVSRKLAYAHEQNGALNLAAAEYYSLGRNRQQSLELRRQAILRAGNLYLEIGDASMAIKAREYYVDQFPEPAESSVAVMEELASLNASRGDADMQQHWLAALIALDNRSGTANTRKFAARAALSLGELSLSKFRKIRLVSPLEANLKTKIKLMESALSEFERAAEYGVAPVSSAATFHMASMYDELGQALLASERPAGLTEDERQHYETLLVEQAAPFRQQAMEIYDLNISRATIGRSDPWVERSVEQLDALRSSSADLPGV